MTDIARRLSATFHATVDPAIELTPSLTAQDVDAWDSLTHVNFIFAIEEEFGIEFSQAEMAHEMSDVGQLESLIARKIATQ